MGTSDDSVEVAVAGDTAYVRVHGRGTFKLAPSLKEFGVGAGMRGCRRIVVEMAGCRGMDSTFMGVLAGLAVHLRKHEGEIILRNLSEKNAMLIRMLGLSHLIRLVHEEDASRMPSGQLLEAASDKQRLAQTMLASHETLVGVAPENAVKFKDVLAYLKEDLQRTGRQNEVDELP